ncbi:hypothetical protein CANINC_001181 [Pichia inconspicua]|uniref:Trimethylguanosine synthase n=1 Tax=Pichia inconspicua TaxID=52247 RepID=A0A4T0X5T4_9ASCO|nr:hypothetical protein CANINC_001181 [[Candida] inconspicua]
MALGRESDGDGDGDGDDEEVFVDAQDSSYDIEDLNTIYNEKSQFTGLMSKYWPQRFTYFSKFNDGAMMTKELWFSVTPENIAKFTAKLMKLALSDKESPLYVMDAFAGAGGNVVFLVESFDVVFAVDINYIHLHCTQNNASLYHSREVIAQKLKLLPLNWSYADDTIDEGYVDEVFENSKEVSDIVDRVYANKADSMESLQVLRGIKLDCIFGSPPWGGPEYTQQRPYNLNHLLPFGLEKLLKVLLKFTDNIVLFLPRTSDLQQMQQVTLDIFHNTKYIRVFRTYSLGKPKGLVCCWGPAFVDVDIQDMVDLMDG